jgi:hypothetical protein
VEDRRRCGRSRRRSTRESSRQTSHATKFMKDDGLDTIDSTWMHCERKEQRGRCKLCGERETRCSNTPPVFVTVRHSSRNDRYRGLDAHVILSDRTLPFGMEKEFDTLPEIARSVIEKVAVKGDRSELCESLSLRRAVRSDHIHPNSSKRSKHTRADRQRVDLRRRSWSR